MKKVPLLHYTCTMRRKKRSSETEKPALRDKGRPVWKPPGTGTVQLRDVHTRVYTDHLMSRLRLALVELGDTYRRHHSVQDSESKNALTGSRIKATVQGTIRYAGRYKGGQDRNGGLGRSCTFDRRARGAGRAKPSPYKQG